MLVVRLSVCLSLAGFLFSAIGIQIKLCDYPANDTICADPGDPCLVANENECFRHQDCDQTGICYGKLRMVNETFIDSENFFDQTQCLIGNSVFDIYLPINICHQVNVFGEIFHSYVTVITAAASNFEINAVWIGAAILTGFLI